MKQDRDKLEKFVAENREAFDTESPRNEVWDNIESGLIWKDRKSAMGAGIVWKAAAVILLVVSTFLVIQQVNLRNEIDQMEAGLHLSEEFRNAEMYYVDIISQKKELVSSFEIDDVQVSNEFEDDIKKLDMIYEELKEELKNNNNEFVLDAMIKNLQLRVEVLNRQLEILEIIEQSKENEEYSI